MKHTRSSASEFWEAVATDLGRHRWTVGIVLLLGVVHIVFTGFSTASLGWLGLLLCISPEFLKWCWRQSASPALLGTIGALALIFLIETYLGVSTRIYGTFDPPGRQPIFLEGPLIQTLGCLYTVRPNQYIELALKVGTLVLVIYLVLHLRRRHPRGAAQRDDRTEWLEPPKKLLEIAGGAMLVLGTLVFANAVDLKATGLNNFAALYQSESRQLGSNTAAIAELRRQLASLKDLSDALATKSTSGNVGPFLDATDALVDALWSLEQTEMAASHLDRVKYQPKENPLPNLTVPFPPPPLERGEPEVNMRVLLKISKVSSLQEQAETAQRLADELLKARDDKVVILTQSIALALERTQRLTPPEKVKILGAIARRVAELVARDGIGQATQEIDDLVMQEQQEVTRQRQANATRRADVTSVPANQAAARNELLTKALLPGSESLKAFAVFIMGAKNKNGGQCGGMPAGIGKVPEKYTADLETANQDGNLRSNPGGTTYHVKLTENKAGESLPNGGFWMDIPDGLIIHADQVAKVCSGSNDRKICNPSPFNIIWTDNGYPTQDNPSLRPTVYCYWPIPHLQ